MTSRNEKPIIEVKHLSKEYEIGIDRTYKTFSESVMNGLRHPIRTLRGLRAPKETFWALKDINFEVERGEVLGIIGRNGAGKSTLLKILCRITYPTDGEVIMRGRVGSLLEVGTGFHPELTGRENIYFNGAILGMKKREIDEKFDEIVKFSGVEKFLDTPVKRYSSGMQVRLAFSVAAHLEPEILLVDEVLAVGDAEFQKKCLGKMGEVASEGRTVLFVSHNMGALSNICQKGIVLTGGELTYIDTIDNSITNYLESIDTNYDNVVSLVDHPNRAKSTKARLTHLSVDLENGVAYYGKPLVFRIGYDFTDQIPAPQFVASFHAINGTKVFTVNSQWQKNNFGEYISGRGEVICSIDSLPLLPGSYSIDLRLWQVGEKLDDIQNAMTFRVEWPNAAEKRYHFSSDMGMIYINAEWNIS